MPVARSFKRGYLSSVPPALHSVLHAAFVRCCGLYRYMCVRVCVCYTTVSTPQAAYPCMVYNGIRNRSFVRFYRRRKFFRSPAPPSIWSLVKSLRPSEDERSLLKCTDIASSVHCAYRHVAHVSRQVQLRLAVAAFAVLSGELLEPRPRVARVDAYVVESLCHCCDGN